MFSSRSERDPSIRLCCESREFSDALEIEI
jgi:hypothetical protein